MKFLENASASPREMNYSEMSQNSIQTVTEL